MKVIRKGNLPRREEFKAELTCSRCTALLEYLYEDISARGGAMWAWDGPPHLEPRRYWVVRCPECGHENEVERPEVM